MLTTKDLGQIKVIVKEVVAQELDEKLKKELNPIKKTLKKIQGDLDTTISYFDRTYTSHENRIRKIETRLQITQSL